MRGWMLAEPGVAMNSATLPDGTSDLMLLAHLLAGDEQVLADVGEAPVRLVGVVGEHRDALLSAADGRPGERLRVDHRAGDAVGAGGDRAC